MTLFNQAEWKEILEVEVKKDYFQKLYKINQEFNCYPKNSKRIFRVFNRLDLKDIKVIILGQDPYHTPNVATGRCFESGNYFSKEFPYCLINKVPPSLNNIIKELEKEKFFNSFKKYLISIDSQNKKVSSFPFENIESINVINKDVEKDIEKNIRNIEVLDILSTFNRWESNGVFLLNTALTVEAHKPNSHLELWRPFTSLVIKSLINKDKPKVWLLWGSKAKNLIFEVIKKEDYSQNSFNISSINNHNLIEVDKNYYKFYNNHFLLSAHPSPFSCHKGFFGNNHFRKCNEILKLNCLKEIPW